MKKISIWLLCAVALAGCGKDIDTTLVKGEIKGLTSDTIYLYGVGGLYERTDTIIADKGKFSCTLKPDTTSVVALLYNHQTVYPLFLEKGNTITIKGTAGEALEVDGNSMNEEFTAFQQELTGLGAPSEKVMEGKAEEYILAHPSSFVSIYLLDTYFVQKEEPDYAKIKMLMDPMTGLLQDAPYVQNLKKLIEQIENIGLEKPIPYFSLPNLKGERISRVDKFNNKYLIIYFWASWCDECQNDFAALRQVNRTYASEAKKVKPKKANETPAPEKKGLGLIGISLDIDKEAWKEAVKKDTLSWEQVYEKQGLNSELVKQFSILKVPTTFLVSPEGRILRRDISADSLSRVLTEFPIEKKR